ncbi:serine/threonine-protein kinase [Paraliomyxa miuraensis]|uniref:serine/threonine-protein kinase n=1 Tax=Paraliomyxa miuraensis TaxID=376150 RepID=UPI002250D116|nr:serine/threonine-protein kinase [Paraliomyxa miuraensis]MCX4246495.1 serine/threonine protein kinase [Paraliomyxa miuraensis]
MSLRLRPGDRYGTYEILDVLGQGGFAWVYRVRANDLPQPAALKVSLEPVRDHATAQRSLREISVLRSLTNSHVVRVHDAGTDDDGHVFILMDELDGAQLDQWHDFDDPMPPGQALWVVHQACLGLAEAHARGIVHRDLKPENLWVEADQNVKVIDFGLARAWDSASTLGRGVTMSGILVGTPRYMQPEQVHGARLTPASDVYSLTTILYELLTGHTVYFADRPFSDVREALRDEPVEWIAAHVRASVVPLSHYPVGAALPESVHALIARGLAKDPGDRYPDARALGNALGQVLHYDLGAVLGATLRVTHPWGGHEDQLLLPGSHRIGTGAHCEVVLRGDELEEEEAVLEWAGPPDLPEVHALHDGGRVTVGGGPVAKAMRRQWGRDESVEVAGYSLRLIHPEV